MIITSNSKRWPGSVIVAEQLTLSQVELIESGLEPVKGDENGKIFFSATDKKAIPAIIACVIKWNLKNFPDPVTLETWPMEARKESHALIRQIWEAIMKVYLGEQEVPNE